MSSILYCCQMTNSYLIQKVALCCHLRNKHGYFAFVNAKKNSWHTNEMSNCKIMFNISYVTQIKSHTGHGMHIIHRKCV